MHRMEALLTCPPESARGLTRWWWYGPRVQKAEILRELDGMRENGIGGVELQMLYPLDPDREDAQNLAFGSPEFYDMLRFVSDACRELGMTMDVTPGSSWPFGGPVISMEEAQQQVLPYQIDVEGPKLFACDLTTRIAGDVIAAVMGRMQGAVMDADSVRDITDAFEVRELFGWPWGTRLRELQIPEGTWKIVFFVRSMHANHVGKPGRNAQGLVLDHCSRKALDVFFHHMTQPICRHAQVHALFCDSIEVEGHNWTGDMFTEFRKRRGYDLHPWIYALWGEVGDVTKRVRYDFFRTMSELTLENFFEHFTRLCHAQGCLSRIQAHGTWGEILRAYACADIPEGETFGEQERYMVNTIHRRLAASSGHVYGKNIISCETFTWLKRPRFTETPEDLKMAVDAVFLDGMNMIVNHGYAYDSGEPRPFYASCNINHRSPWWPDYRYLGAYIQRVSALLREGRHVSEVAVYLPEADIFAQSMLSELHLAMCLEDYMGREDMDRIQKLGYWFDYVNDEALTRLGAMEEGGLRLSGNLYRVLILPRVTMMEPETARAVERFRNMHGTVLCLETRPESACGLMDREDGDREVRAVMDRVWPGPGLSMPGLKQALREALEPEVHISEPEHVGFVHRKAVWGDLWFFANQSADMRDTRFVFRDMTGPCSVLSPQKLDGSMHRTFDWDEAERCLHVCLEPHESIAVCFGEEAEAQEETGNYVPICRLTDWSLTIAGEQRRMQEPVWWTDLTGLEHTGGEGVYEVKFVCPASGRYRLRLTDVGCTAGLEMDGRILDSLWMRPWRADLGWMQEGTEHVLRLRVRSTLFHSMLAGPEPEDVPDELDAWPYYGKVIMDQRRARLNLDRERKYTGSVHSGLNGPAFLECRA